MVKNLPAMQETWFHSLGQEDALEKEMATHSSILAWENPMDRGAWRGTVHGVTKDSDMTLQLKQQQIVNNFKSMKIHLVLLELWFFKIT